MTMQDLVPMLERHAGLDCRLVRSDVRAEAHQAAGKGAGLFRRR
jgi:hypothetical protein